MDPDSSNVIWNQHMFDIYGVPVRTNLTISREQWFSCIHPEDAPIVREIIEQVINGNDSSFDEMFRILRPNGEVRYLTAQAHVSRDAQGKAITMTGVNRDVTEQLQQEYQLLEAKERADSSSQAKSQFLANMSHEIRTPLNAVIGLLKLLERSPLDRYQYEYVGKAESAAQSLLVLLNDVLDYSKIEVGKMEVDPHPFELEKLFEDLAAVLWDNQDNQHVELIFDLPPNLPRQVVGDQTRIFQVLMNLAGNALKFTHEGQVVVRAQVLSLALDVLSLRLEVTDTGIGISTEQQGRLFEGFQQAEASTSRRYGGTGLGLAISKRLVGLFGGKLKLESAEGLGSRFWFDISLPITDGKPIVDIDHSQISKTVAIIHPCDTVSQVLTRHLHGLNFNVCQVSKEDFDDKRKLFDYVFIAGGLLAQASFRESLDRLGGLVIPVGIDVQTELKCFTPALPLPYLPSQLQSRLNLTSREDRKVTSSSNNTSGKLEGVRILCVEDNPLNREVVRELLRQEGAIVSLAESGVQSIAMLSDPEQTFDVVLMDMQMPEMDGLEATRRIRAIKHLQALPIIALTANASDTDVENCLAAGMNHHLAKPIAIDAVVNAIHACKNGQQQPLLSGSTHQVPQASNASSTPVTAIEDLLEEYQEIFTRFGRDVQLITELMAKFGPEIDKQISQIKNQIQADDPGQVKAALHTVKGLAMTAGAKQLALHAQQLEKSFKVEPMPVPKTILTDSVLSEFEGLAKRSDELLQAMVAQNSGT